MGFKEGVECVSCGSPKGFHDPACYWHPSNIRIRELEAEVARLKNPQSWPKMYRTTIPFDGKKVLEIGTSLGLTSYALGKFVKCFKDIPVKMKVTLAGDVTFLNPDSKE